VPPPPTRATDAARFGFVQWEFAGRLGPEQGRYVVRRFAGDDVQQVVVIGGLAAPRRRPLTARRRRVDEPVDTDVDVTRATVIEATPLRSDAEATAWLSAALSGEETIAAALAVLTRAVAARRVAAADPWLADPDPDRALTTRVGYGEGEAVAHGDWEVAHELEAGRRRRARRALDPQERVAALLSGRDAALACEELARRGRADLDRGRGREAALQVDVALRVALAELEGWREHRDMPDRLAELERLAPPAAAAAAAALQRGLSDDETAAVVTALARLEAALRARTAGA
jgi:hypothetical protein